MKCNCHILFDHIPRFISITLSFDFKFIQNLIGWVPGPATKLSEGPLQGIHDRNLAKPLFVWLMTMAKAEETLVHALDSPPLSGYSFHFLCFETLHAFLVGVSRKD